MKKPAGNPKDNLFKYKVQLGMRSQWNASTGEGSHD